MRKRSRILELALGSVSTLALAAAAHAQPAHNWSGFYAGGYLGAARGHSDVNTRMPCPTPNFPAMLCGGIPPREAPKVTTAGTGSMSDTGFTGGVQAGHNWQTGAFVYGLEADFGAFNIQASRQSNVTYTTISVPPGSFSSPRATATIRSTADTDWLLTARARAGWTVSNLLLYATGGLAVTNLRGSHTYTDNSIFALAGNWSASATKVGWTVGGGLEWAVTQKWSIKAEYLYAKFGSVNASGLIRAPGFGYSDAINTSVDLAAHMARVGANFRF